MDDFFKTKVGFTIGLLAAVFTIKPLIDANGSFGFAVFGLKITIEYAYLFLMACLGLAVYFISLQFASKRHVGVLDKASNACYAVALATPPVFVAFWALTVIMNLVGRVVVQIPQSVLTAVAGVIAGALGNYLYKFLTNSIQFKLSRAEKEQERKNDLSVLVRASDLFNSGMYDLSVLESSKVVESIIRRMLDMRGVSVENINMYELIRLIQSQRLLNKNDIELLHEIRKYRNESVHTVGKISRLTAERVLNLSRELIFKLEHSSDSVGYAWLENNRKKVIELFKEGDSRKSKKALEMLKMAWKNRDGAIWLEIADFFEAALIHNPNLIIDMFDNDEELLDSWLEKAEVQLFTDFAGGQKERYKKVKNAILQSLSEYINNTKSPEKLEVAKKIYSTLESAEVREID
ncbi:hypothetical protein J4377_07025 [Halomonas sp. XH26]|uniref:hypothetical protein n=1 Tax=Halomonas sp. XH26 TaxID=2557993 RepID=UPI0020A10564|nr:hypothetical protein [Halomonas sp. XH26]UTA81214.1 hypothetical protein J4377_07025 [Halomonas sp. XH26]